MAETGTYLLYNFVTNLIFNYNYVSNCVALFKGEDPGKYNNNS